MMTRTISMTAGLLVEIVVWSAAMTTAVFVTVLAMHVLVIAGFAVYQLMRP